MSNDYIEHYGVKGMKWRVHRRRRSAYDAGSGDKGSGSKYDNGSTNLRVVRDGKLVEYVPKHQTYGTGVAKGGSNWGVRRLGNPATGQRRSELPQEGYRMRSSGAYWHAQNYPTLGEYDKKTSSDDALAKKKKKVQLGVRRTLGK